MKKIIVGIVVVILIVVGVSYFGKNSSQPTAKESIKIGVILPLSGTAALIGEAAKNSAILAKESFGKTKNTYELIFEDDQIDSKKTVLAFRKLVDMNNIKAVITGFSGPGNAIAPLAEKEHVIHFSIGSTDTTIPKNKKFVFSHWLLPEKQAEVYIKEAKIRGLKKIAMIVVNQQGTIATREALLKEDPTIFILKNDTISPEERDFRTIITKAKNEKADALMLLTLPGQLTSTVKQIKDLGITVPLTSAGSIEHEKEAVSLLEGQWYVNPGGPSDTFVEKYKEKYGNLPQIGSGNVYDVINILISSFEKSKGVDNVVNIISEIKDFPGVMGVLDMDSEGIISGTAIVKKIINGKFVEVK